MAAEAHEAAGELLDSLTVYDVEVHTSEPYPELTTYIEDEETREREQAGYMFGPDDFGPIPWDGWDRSAGGRINWDGSAVGSADAFAEINEENGFGIDTVVYSPGTGFKIFQIPDADSRITYMRAQNRLTADRFALADGTNYGKIHIVPDHPEESAEEIEKYGDDDGFVGVFFANMLEQPFGHERHDPIFEAAEANDLPIFLHGESSMFAGFPTDRFRGLRKYVSVHSLVHPFLQLWHAASLIEQEIPERFDLDICFLEAGQSWIQMLAHRMDREYVERPSDIPGATKLPSEYLSEFYYGTQPLEEPRDPDDLGWLLEMNEIEDRLVLATDYPHMDFDAPMSVAGHPGLSDEQKEKILQDNPSRLLGL